jgi:signal transduction histidine kinase
VTVLAAKNGYFALSAMFVEEPLEGTDPLVWGTAVSGVVGATLLATAGLWRDRQIDNSPMLVSGVVLAGVVTVVGLDLAAGVFREWLPAAFPFIPDDDELVVGLDRFSGHPAKIALDLCTAAAYSVAAVAFARLADRDRDNVIGWMAVGSMIAACAFVYYAVVPSRFTELLYGGEILWLFAIMPLSYGAISEISNLESGLVRAAVRAERKRVARDLHDGVVQELAYIATQKQWLLERVIGTPYEASVRRIGDAVDRALDESRGAIAALNRELEESLSQAVIHAAGDVADRSGLILHAQVEPGATASGEWRDALIRIVREAVGNAARHGGAREVTISLAESPLVLTVTDDGHGFDPEAPRSAHNFGLQSMRERAESLGGRFEVSSRPGEGTVVRITLP